MPSDQLILVFGEDDNDRRALVNLIRAFVPNGKDVRIETRRRPTILSRDAHRKRPRMAEEVAAFWRAERARARRVDVVAHRDCDAVEPAHATEAAALVSDLRAAGVPNVIAATPAWEIETWWMLFPEAVQAVRRCWKVVNYHSGNVGVIQNAKERLRRDLRPSGAASKTCPDFVESDGIRISEEILKRGLAGTPRLAKSASFEAFKSDLRSALSSAP